MNLYQKYTKNAMKIVHNMTVTEVWLFKLAIALATIVLIKLLPIVASLSIWIYFIAFVAVAAYVMRNMKWK